MNPVAFTVFGLDIMWYGIFIATGMIVGTLLAAYTSKLKNIDYEMLIDTLLIALPIGIIGARLYYVAFEWERYRGDFSAIINIREGGLAIHGGLIFGLSAAAIFLYKKKADILSCLDVVVPSIALAQAIGRWGNFANKEAHGGEVTVEFISKFPEFIQNGMYINGAYHHPTFLYESVWNVGLCILLIYMLRKKLKPGVVTFTYIGMYSLVRFFIEGLRTDSLYFGAIRVAQLVSIIGLVAWIGFLVYTWRKDKTLKEV